MIVPPPKEEQPLSLLEPLNAFTDRASLLGALVFAEALAPPLALRSGPHDHRA